MLDIWFETYKKPSKLSNAKAQRLQYHLKTLQDQKSYAFLRVFAPLR